MPQPLEEFTNALGLGLQAIHEPSGQNTGPEWGLWAVEKAHGWLHVSAGLADPNGRPVSICTEHRSDARFCCNAASTQPLEAKETSRDFTEEQAGGRVLRPSGVLQTCPQCKRTGVYLSSRWRGRHDEQWIHAAALTTRGREFVGYTVLDACKQVAERKKRVPKAVRERRLARRAARREEES